jgi:hypothetical protein
LATQTTLPDIAWLRSEAAEGLLGQAFFGRSGEHVIGSGDDVRYADGFETRMVLWIRKHDQPDVSVATLRREVLYPRLKVFIGHDLENQVALIHPVVLQLSLIHCLGFVCRGALQFETDQMQPRGVCARRFDPKASEEIGICIPALAINAHPRNILNHAINDQIAPGALYSVSQTSPNHSPTSAIKSDSKTFLPSTFLRTSGRSDPTRRDARYSSATKA